MKKLIAITLLTLLSITILSSCQARGPKCPGMYSEVDNVQTTSIEINNLD